MRIDLYKHAAEQGAGLSALRLLALSSLRPQRGGPVQVPGPWLEEKVPAPGRALVRHYILENNGAPEDWGTELPPHLFAHFGIPLAMRVIAGLPYPVRRTLNAGCAWVKRAPLPSGARLDVRARLESLDADDSRVKATVKIVAGTGTAPDALDAEMRVFIPLSRKPSKRPGEAKRGEAKREVATVPADAKRCGRVSIGADAGAVFAALTGDFNPIHWLWPAARMAGFKSCILQGFAMHARAVELLGASLPGRVRSLTGVDVKFARPLVLPAQIGVFASDTSFWLGTAPGAPANLIGSYQALRE